MPRSFHLLPYFFHFLLAHASIIPRADPPFQYVPSKATTPDNKFNIATTIFQGQPPDTTDVAPDVYGARSVSLVPDVMTSKRNPETVCTQIDIPFALLNKGDLKLFTAGQLNTPAGTTDSWKPGVDDFASQSACGIPDNAFEPSKVAIHPYWLKYAPEDLGLSRYCMQDVCISVWNDSDDAGGAGDDGGQILLLLCVVLTDEETVELKVTDICSTDPADPGYCATPTDIKIDRIKADLLYSSVKNQSKAQKQALRSGAEYPDGKVYWFFSKCWDDVRSSITL